MTKNYLRLQIKNCIKIMGKSARNTLFIFAAIVMAVVVCSVLLMKSRVFEVIDVAIVLPEEKNDSKWALDFLLSTESVKSVCDITYYQEEEQAMKALKKGNVKAVISLSADFYEDIDTGVNTPVSIFIPRHISLNTSVFIELLDKAVKMLQVAESGVYSSISVAGKGSIGDDVAVLYAIAAIDRKMVFEKKIVSATDEVDMYQYYFSSALLVFLMIMSINFVHMYAIENRSLEQIISIYGVSKFRQSVIKTGIMAAIIWIVMIVYYAIAYLLSGFIHYDFIELDIMRVLSLGSVALAMASFIHLVMSLVGRSQYSYGIMLVIYIVMILCSGIIVPLVYFPALIQRIGNLMPLAIWQESILRIVFDQAALGIVAASILTLIQFGIGTVILCRKK